MADPARAPSARWQRRGRPVRRATRRKVQWRWLALAVGALAIAGLATLALRPAAPDARLSLAQGVALLDAGNYSAARNKAAIAVQGRPDWGLAHAVLARAQLALGDGYAAEGEVTRARATGFPVERTHHLLAHAWLLQGQTDQALDEAESAPPRYALYAARVRARALGDQGDYAAATDTLRLVIAAAAADDLAWSDLARVRFASGDILGADEAASRALALHRGNLDAVVMKGQIVRARYGLAAALPWFDAALARDAYYHPALIEKAATLGDLGRYTDMLDATRKALLARPGSARALYLQAVLAARAGRWELAGAMLAKTGGALDGVPGRLLVAGGVDYAAGRYEQAAVKWRELVGRQPMNLVARRLLGAALLRGRDAQGALDTLRPAALRSDADGYTLGLVARAFEATGQRDWAAAYLDRAARPPVPAPLAFASADGLAVAASAAAEARGDVAAGVAYIRALLAGGNVAGALAHADRVAAENPGSADAQLTVGDTLAAANRSADAARAYARAADLRFDTPTMLRLVDARARAGDRAGASEALALFLGQNPQSVTARRVAASLRLATGDWVAAIDTLEGLRAALGDRDSGLLAQLALAHAGADDGGLASGYARAAYRLAPMNPGVVDAYGWARYAAGDLRGAAQLLDKAARLAPGDAGIAWHRAQVLADGGDAAGAKAMLVRLLADPAFADRAPAAALLRTLG